MMTSFVNISSPKNVMNYVGQIGDDWGSTSPVSARKTISKKTSEGTNLQLILMDDSNEDERHTFDIGSSTTLKTLFNDYAEKRGISLRLLRFSYNGKTLFLSSVGSKTPDECMMRDQDVITVHDTSSVQEPSISASNQTKKSTAKKSKSNKPKKAKGKKKKQTKQHQNKEPEMSLEEYKAQHSKILTKLHEEAEPRLKEIRTRLNALDLERQPPKQKKKKNKKKKNFNKEVIDFQMLPTSGVGGKAGKPRFEVQVGEVQNLYKTTKPSVMAASQKSMMCSSATQSTTLDLHGCTKEEALHQLDTNLKVWVDTAMQGSYPFVIPATIVCGCGNQILSKAVENWIKSTRNVCNAPKSKYTYAAQ